MRRSAPHGDSAMTTGHAPLSKTGKQVGTQYVQLVVVKLEKFLPSTVASEIVKPRTSTREVL